jgi:predicted nucleic acid-binding protein
VIVTFDTNVLFYASAPDKSSKAERARDLIARGMKAEGCFLLLQTLAELANAAIRKAALPAADVGAIIDSWRVVLPVRAAEVDDIVAALEAVRAHRFAFWDAMLWAAARRLGVRYFLTEDMQDGFALDGVRFVNPFVVANDDLIDEVLPAS